MYNFSNQAKTRIIEGKIIRAYLRVLATDTLPEIRINEENYLKDIQFEDFRYVPDEGIFGGTVAKKVIVNFANVDETFSIQDREFELYIGVELEDETMEYQKYGTFIVQKPENNQINDNTYCEALDYMVKFNEPYVDRMTYPCTLKQLFNDVVSQAGMQVGTTSFLNDSFVVENNQFEEGTTLRDVLKAIAQVAFNWIAIDENNQVVMDFEMKDTIDETLDIDNYFDFSKQEQYGPINVITFKESQIQGQEISISDSESISEYGENELAIVDNPFAYTQTKKQQLIQAGSNLFGFKYIPVSLNSIGYIYLNRKDKIKLINLNEQEFETYIFNHTINYNGVALDSIESPAETKNESKYEYNSDIDKRTRRTELKVDKQNQTIQSVVSQVEYQEEQISTITQTVEGIETTVSNKVGADEIISKINQSAEQIQINANKISLAGKAINLTSDNITINSTNFSVDKNGNLICSNATITGGNIKLVQTGTTALFEITDNQSSLIIYKNGIYMSNSYWSNNGINFNGTLLTKDDLFLINYDGGSTVIDNKGIKIPKNGTAGYGLCNTSGNSIIRDHNNHNVTVDATGGTLFLGYQNTTDLNILNGKIKIEDNVIYIGDTNSTNSANLQIRNSAHVATFFINSGGSMGVWSSTLNRWSWVHYPSNGNLELNGNTVTIDTSGNITSNGSISNNYGRIYQMTKGTVNITPSGANTPTGKAVQFSKAFSSAPTVYTTPVTSAPGTTVKGTGVSSITARECVIYITRTNTTATGVNWVAFC